MFSSNLWTNRARATSLIAILVVLGLTVEFFARQGGGTLKAVGTIGNKPSVTINILVPTPSARASEHARNYKVDVWATRHEPATNPTSLVVYIPGWGGVRSDNTALLTALADAGYVVLALDDLAHDAPYDDPLDEAARTAPFDLSTETATRNLINAAHRRTVLQFKKVSQLLDMLATAPAALPQLASLGSILDRVGVLGYSFGGATAAEAGKHDTRVVAVVNLDGWHFGPGADQTATFPYLMINSIESRLDPEGERGGDSQRRNEAILNAAENERQIIQATARSDTYRLYLQGARHGDLSDAVGSWRRVLSRLKSGGALIAAGQARRTIDATIIGFFDMHLRQLQGASLPKVLAAHRDLIDLGPKPFR